jgi:hypothetical protein
MVRPFPPNHAFLSVVSVRLPRRGVAGCGLELRCWIWVQIDHARCRPHSPEGIALLELALTLVGTRPKLGIA